MKKLLLLLLLPLMMLFSCGNAQFKTTDVAADKAIYSSLNYQIHNEQGWMTVGSAVVYQPSIFHRKRIVTAAHVAILDSMFESRVCEVKRPLNCQIVEGARFHKTSDIALLSVGNSKVFRSVYDDNDVRLGQDIMVSGHPYGEHHLTSGTVTRTEQDMFYVDARCIVGNSGGGVYDKEGNLIGIVSALRILHNGQMETNWCYVVRITEAQEI